MKIATFNANSVRSRLDAILTWLAGEAPDVLCIQETKTPDASFPALALRGAGYHSAFRGEKSYNGVAILSREAPREVAFGFDDGGPPDETRLMCARFGEVHVVNTYVPQGRLIDHEMYAYKLEWFRRLRSYFDRRFKPTSNVVWVGDLNVAPEPADVHNPERQKKHVCFHDDVRAAFADTVSWGFVDVLRQHHPEPGQFTFFDYRTPNAVDRGMGWRIDHILATTPMSERCTDACIDIEPRKQPRPSDHTYLTACFTVLI